MGTARAEQLRERLAQGLAARPVLRAALRALGAGGFCFWANRSEEGMDLSGYRPGQLAITQTSWLYDDGRGLGWNYFYTYW